MSFFEIFLPVTAVLLSLIGLVVAYWVVTHSDESEFIPTFYFIAFSIVSILMTGLSRTAKALLDTHLFNYPLMVDLMIAWASLFLFGALWQSYEASVVIKPSHLEE